MIIETANKATSAYTPTKPYNHQKNPIPIKIANI